jgi:predicted acylesterase/phospholipase RssA
VQWWIDHDLGFIDLADLEVPVIPVTTNAHNGHEWDIRAGLIGHACTASGSLPPLAPTHDKDTRLIDGALSAAVPSRALVEAGADLVVGANVVPPTRPRAPSGITLARELNPLTRIDDMLRSYFMLFRQASYSQERFADVTYSAESPTGNGATFYKHRTLIDHAERSPSLEQAIARATACWQQLRDTH